MGLENNQIVVTARLVGLSASVPTGRAGGGGAADRPGSVPLRDLKLDIDTLTRRLPPPPSGESFSTVAVVPAGFPLEALPLGFKPTTILVSQSRTTVAGAHTSSTAAAFAETVASMAANGWWQIGPNAGFKAVAGAGDDSQWLGRFDSTEQTNGPRRSLIISVTAVPGSAQIDALLHVFAREGR